MKEFLVKWTDRVLKEVVIEAETIEEARELFFDWDFKEDRIRVGDESVDPQSVVIEEN